MGKAISHPEVEISGGYPAGPAPPGHPPREAAADSVPSFPSAADGTDSAGDSPVGGVPDGPLAPGFSGQGLNMMSNEADSRHRLINLTPTPRWESRGGSKSSWHAGYALSPAVDVWAERVRRADPAKPARVVGVVGATSAGKSWLVGKLLDERSAKPSRLEEHFDGVTLQSMTSDINVYTDSGEDTYYMDFEGTYGTQPLQLSTVGHGAVLERCKDMRAWETMRRQSLKECYQPAVAYLLCNIVIFVTREKLVCSRCVEECEHFAQAANGRVISALPPALILVQNCCRPSEGLFNPVQCTEAFRQTHLYSESVEWHSYFRSVDCFCVPEETLYCKRTGFDGEEVCKEVMRSLKETVRKRLDEDLAFRLGHHVRLSQLQWFSVVSALCRIVNDNDTVKMTSLYMHVGATTCGLGELKSALLLLMGARGDSRGTVKELLRGALALIARFTVRRELSAEEQRQAVLYLQGLFPCGACAPNGVECYGRPGEAVICGQMKMIHTDMHRSSELVRTRNAEWLQGLSEWLRGGVIHAWMGEYTCHPCFQEFDNTDRLCAMLQEEINGYKLERCLEGLAPDVGSPWVLKAYSSFRGSPLKLRKDISQTCVLCAAKGMDPGFFGRLWAPPEGTHLAVCEHCFGLLQKHDLCGQIVAANPICDLRCDACCPRDPWSGLRRSSPGENRLADHRLLPCRCSICRHCAEATVRHDFPTCPLCAQPLFSMVDERALVKSSWPAAVRRQHSSAPRRGSSCGTSCGARKA